MVSPCVYCGKCTWYRSAEQCPANAQVEECCAFVVCQTSKDLPPGEAAALYDCLVVHVGQSPANQQCGIDPLQLLYQGWQTFVVSLFQSCDSTAFLRYRPGLIAFRERFAQAFALPAAARGKELYRQMEVLHRVEKDTPIEKDLCLSYDPDPDVGVHVLPSEQGQILWSRPGILAAADQKLTIVAIVALLGLGLSVAFEWPARLAAWEEFPESLLPLLDHWLSNLLVPIAVGVPATLAYWLIPGRVRLVLTTEALYYNGWLLRRHLPLNHICKVSVRDNALRLQLPAGAVVKFWVGHWEARWLRNVLVARGVPCTPR